ncbi:glycosyl hydrolase family 8 [Lacimonas salitolerans]|uniref:cellulase n=1 Tax=Lacimonas salitolerans TaxID=1323750 RepID=A0ABW4EEC3_9RHOB
MIPSAGFAGASLASDGAVPGSDWHRWKAAFLRPEGRVVDALQDKSSHSEGQGWAMLLAASHGDADSFSRMFDWTERHLAVRQDPLLSWRWRPADAIADYNNASDGDLFYAWALLVAARRFGVEAYARRSGELAHAIDRILVKPAPGGGLLLRPAAEKFSATDHEIVNLSYIMPLALHALGAAFDLPRLGQVADDGEALIARVARAGLVPDWITLDDNGWAPASGYGPQYGYDALRVALYLVWSGRLAHPAVTRTRALLTDGQAETPVRADPETLDVLERSDAPGYAAVSHLIRNSALAGPDAAITKFSASQPYYPATLHLLAALAQRQITLA